MRVEGWLFVGTAGFFVAVTTLYWFTSYEETGSVLLLLTAGLGLLPGLWLLWWSRRMAPRPEDREDAELREGAGEVARFPGPTIWPFVVGVGMVLAANGVAFGIWPAIPGALLVAAGAAGATLAGRRP